MCRARALHALTGDRFQTHAVARQLGHLVVLEEQHAPGVREQRWNVATAQGCAITQADDQRRSILGHDDAIGLFRRCNRERVGATHASERSSHGFEQARALLHRAVDEVRDDLGVGVALEAHAVLLELALQLQVILDDAVVNDRDVTGQMRVRVRLARPTVRCPARVADARGAVELPALDRSRQVIELADGADQLQRAPVMDRETGRVVTAIFELT